MEQIQEKFTKKCDDLGNKKQYSLKREIINPNKNNCLNNWNNRLNIRLKKFELSYSANK